MYCNRRGGYGRRYCFSFHEDAGCTVSVSGRTCYTYYGVASVTMLFRYHRGDYLDGPGHVGESRTVHS